MAAAAAARPGRPGASGRGRRGRAGRGAGAGRTWPENSGDHLPSCGPAVPYRLGGLESLLAVRDLETRQTAQGQRKQKGRPEGQIQAEVERDTQSEIEGTNPGLKTQSERTSNPRRQKARRTRNSEAERERGESRGQKRAAAETEALARRDAGTRRERFGSVTVLPHLEDITSPLKKNKYKKGLDIKRRQILLSLEGMGRRWPG